MAQKKYMSNMQDSLSSSDRELIGAFIDKFMATHSYKGLSLRVSSREVKDFLQSQNSRLSFTKFNKISRCRGITTSNLYDYSLLLLHILKEEPAERKRMRAYPKDKIFTIDWHGSKRYFRNEWSLLLDYAAKDLSCDTLVDAFAGTGYISLQAAKLGLYSNIIQNDINTELYNYYCVMKDESKFKEFINILKELPEPTKEAYNLLESYYKGKRMDKQLQTVSVERAVLFFYKQHYSYSGVGGHSTVKLPLECYTANLRDTHSLYKDIELKHLCYNNCIKPYIEDTKSLVVIDSPYCKIYREQKKSYAVEFNSEEQHKEMLENVKGVQARVILCGYRTEDRDLYGEILNKDSDSTWHCIKFTRESSKSKNHEHIWTNFDIEGLLSKPDSNKMFEFIY